MNFIETETTESDHVVPPSVVNLEVQDQTRVLKPMLGVTHEHLDPLV